MSIDLVKQAMKGDFTGMSFAVLARLSNESRRMRHLKDQEAAGVEAAARPRTGLDINNREEQVMDCTEAITRGGGTVVYVYDEPHTSAYKRRRIVLEDGSVIFRVVRPIYEGMLQDLAKGKAPNGERLDGVICPDLDRLTRDPRHLEDSIDVVSRHHRPILDLSGALDLNTTSGQTNARVIVAFKNAQSADTARRVGRKHTALQREGIPTGGTRPFGWNEDKRTLHPEESKLLRTAVKEILAGRAVTSVAADWNRRGITTVRGKVWRAVNLKAVLRNPRMAGYRMVTVQNAEDSGETRSRHTVTLLNEEGKPVIGQWEPMITPQDWTTLTALIGDKPQRGDGNNTRSHLCTGTLRCGKCDTPMRALKAPRSANKPEGFFYYACLSKSEGGCGGIKIVGPNTDAAVIALAIAKYEREAELRDAELIPQRWEGEAQLARVHEDIAAAKAARKAGRISAERYYADLAEYEQEERALMRERNTHVRRAQAQTGAPATLRDDWLSGRLTLTEQRSYVERALTAVIVNPAARRGQDPKERLTPVYTGDEEA
jgi:site-specific DNA recombinase